ncbi:MAG: hypothetical protein JNN33_01515 [Rhodospirillaceae bacterium]|nr:hypothetical protein [Rhodospirillaceae bacterium]
MRMGMLYVVVALLIAAFAIGTPLPAQANCVECQDCTTEAPAKKDGPCSEKGLVCQIASSCASQVQKAPAHIVSQAAVDISSIAFGYESSIALNSAFITPETAPPCL